MHPRGCSLTKTAKPRGAAKTLRSNGVRTVYYGWHIVGLAMLVYTLMVGATFGAFGLFVLPVSTELKLSRADMNSALILLNLGNAALAPFVGRLLDRVPLRRIMTVGAVLLGSSLIVLGLSPWLWLSVFVLAVLLPAGYLSAGTLSVTVLIARWFTVRRGRAMALATIGMSLGQVIVPPTVGLLIADQGWRTTLMVVGGLIGAMLLVIAMIIRERPGPGELEGDDGRTPPTSLALKSEPAAPAKVRDLLGNAQFWFVSLAAAASLGVAQALGISLVPLGTANGLGILQATSLISVMGGGAIAGTLLLAIVADKVDRTLLLTALFLVIAVVNFGLVLNGGYPLLLGCSALLGLAVGATTPAFFALLADRFGAASFGTVRGLTMPIMAVFGMIAVRLAGEVYDRTGAYDLLFMGFIVVQLLSAGLIFGSRFLAPISARSAAASPPTG